MSSYVSRNQGMFLRALLILLAMVLVVSSSVPVSAQDGGDSREAFVSVEDRTGSLSQSELDAVAQHIDAQVEPYLAENPTATAQDVEQFVLSELSDFGLNDVDIEVNEEAAGIIVIILIIIFVLIPLTAS